MKPGLSSSTRSNVGGKFKTNPAFSFRRDKKTGARHRLFFIHSRGVDEAAFERHAEESHTQRFIARVEALIDHPLDIQRTHLLGRHS